MPRDTRRPSLFPTALSSSPPIFTGGAALTWVPVRQHAPIPARPSIERESAPNLLKKISCRSGRVWRGEGGCRGSSRLSCDCACAVAMRPGPVVRPSDGLTARREGRWWPGGGQTVAYMGQVRCSFVSNFILPGSRCDFRQLRDELQLPGAPRFLALLSPWSLPSPSWWG